MGGPTVGLLRHPGRGRAGDPRLAHHHPAQAPERAMTDVSPATVSTGSPRRGSAIRRVLLAMLLGVVVYGGYAVYAGLGKMGDELARFHWWAFGAACALAFGNYLVRWLKWEFYLARLGIKGVGRADSLLTFLSGFVLTVTTGKVGEVFKSVVLFETHGVPVARTAPIVVAERVTDVIGVVVLIVIGSLGFSGGLFWVGHGTTAVLSLVVVVSSRRLSVAPVGVVKRLRGPFR